MKKYIALVLVLAVLLLSLPLLVRFGKNPLLAGTEGYYHARMAIGLTESLPGYDGALVSPRAYVIHPYHLVLAGGYALLGARVFSLFPFVFALAAVGLFWRLLREFSVGEERQLWMLLAFVLSPPLIAASFLNTPHAFVLVLFLAGLLLLLSPLWIAGAFLLVLAAFCGVAAMIAVVAGLLLLIFLQKGDVGRNGTLILVVFVLFASGVYSPTIGVDAGVAHYLSDVGGLYGLSVFAFLLALVGALQVWQHKRVYYGAYATGILFFVTSFFFPDVLVFANVLVCVLAGVALSKLAARKWELSFLRDAVLLVIFCGLLFSGVSQGVSLAKLAPDTKFFAGLSFPQGVVLTHEKYGFWVEAAGHRVVVDGLSSVDEVREVARLLNATELDVARGMLERYGVTHVVITDEMKHGLFWERENQGLAFLVSNVELFKKISEGDGVEVWEVVWKSKNK